MGTVKVQRRDYGEIIKLSDALWKHKNPKSKMDTPNMVYEQVEKIWDEWRNDNMPFEEYLIEKLGLFK